MVWGSKRHEVVDLWRFIASLLIMARHLCFLGLERGSYHFWETWIWVEFFFMLSGYYTILHFNKDKSDSVSLDTRAQNAIVYTIHKAIGFYPYVIIAITIKYFIDYIVTKYSIGNLINYIFDLTLLTGSFKDEYMQIGLLWFLAAMLIAFPCFCLVCQIRSRYLLYIISFYIVIFYYGYNETFYFYTFPMHAFRALAGLFAGILVYAISEKVRSMTFSVWQRVFITAMEVGCLLLTVICAYNNKIHIRFYLLCFIVGLSLMLSQQTFTAKIGGHGIFSWLGKISMPIYIFHMVIVDIINYYLYDLSIINKIIVYYLGTIICSIIMYTVVEKIKRLVKTVNVIS